MSEEKATDSEGFKVPSVPSARQNSQPRPESVPEEGTAESPAVAEDQNNDGAPTSGKDATPEANQHDQAPMEVDKEEFKVPSLPSARQIPSQAPQTAPVASGDKAPPTTNPATTTVVTDSAPRLPYNEPSWSSAPLVPHSLTVIKSGSVIQELSLSGKPFHVFGRLPSCDVQLEHPSISRHHAVLQYRPPNTATGSEDKDDDEPPDTTPLLPPSEGGFYVYDLGSTHGTFVNKTKVRSRCYCRLRLGQMLKFGGSSRLFLLEVSNNYGSEFTPNSGHL